MKKTVLIIHILIVQSLLGQQMGEQQKTPLVDNQSFVSSLMKTKVDFHTYFPDAYKSDTTSYFPVIYWLHGSGGWPPYALNLIANRFHLAIKDEKIPPVIVVFLDDGKRESMWIDWKDGSVKMESVIINEVIPHIDRSFRTINNGQGRILEGGSMGGYGVARLGFKYPEMFAAISMLNPGPMQEVLNPKTAPLAGEVKAQKTLDRVYGGDIEFFREQSPWQIALKNVDKIRGNIKVRIILGGEDPSLINNKKFVEHLKKLEIEHTTIILEGVAHSPKAMFGALDDRYWDFFRENFTN
ncbi:alpha/beta hydrolase [Zeaxanthinibacter enoshimensis]|uniref:S-formylglutathione hydrolase FrmB n=1 Tax=Zeaxanthinibacter enoshimensis TaxID=392009 RepID=A0A4R6TS21_9FLAO|nr:alpha/beta hydrolase-fold protein [Zeaxanthinibacter enoshimensis]TDQ33127.1 S-formylglutathione hydrolase FrmB [Zeaxanthinibacter enoshimensis]